MQLRRDRAVEVAARCLERLADVGGQRVGPQVRVVAGAAFLNRGNSKLNKDDLAGAIADWKIADGLGVKSASARLREYDTGS